MRRPLYRNAVPAVILLALLAALALAQGLKHSHQLRAIALVELYGPAGKPTGGKVVPVVIKVQDKFYDAETYDATPRPLALDSGTVYEAISGGESAGLFTVAAAKQLKGDWYGIGQWKSAAEVKRAQARADAERKAREKAEADEGPPSLHKGKGASEHKPVNEPHVVTNEPRLEKPPATAQAPETAPDPDRPTLRHGPGEQVKPMLDIPPAAPAPKPGIAQKPGGPSQVFIAISDPDGTGALRPFAFPWKPDEEQQLKAKTVALAEAELNKYIAARDSATARPDEKTHKTAGKHLPHSPALKLENPMVTGYDLNLDNNAELVVVGSSGPYYVTLIARTDLQFVPQKVFAQVTDKDHLDAVPRMELIGPIDADGRGKGDLLFRVLSDTDYRYALYRVHRDEAYSLWESGVYEQ
jgi:hypothetical protein